MPDDETKTALKTSVFYDHLTQLTACEDFTQFTTKATDYTSQSHLSFSLLSFSIVVQNINIHPP
jgi:hypothetical protein